MAYKTSQLAQMVVTCYGIGWHNIYIALETTLGYLGGKLLRLFKSRHAIEGVMIAINKSSVIDLVMSFPFDYSNNINLRCCWLGSVNGHYG